MELSRCAPFPPEDQLVRKSHKILRPVLGWDGKAESRIQTEPEVQMCFLTSHRWEQEESHLSEGERLLKTETLLTPSFGALWPPNCTLLSTQIPLYQGRLWEREEGKPGRGKTDEQTLRFRCLGRYPPWHPWIPIRVWEHFSRTERRALNATLLQ